MTTARSEMRAKFVLESVLHSQGQEGLTMRAVSNTTPEENTFSKWTPSGTLSMVVTNPNLLGKFKPGDKFYLDFIPAAN